MNSRQRRQLRRFSERMYLSTEYVMRAHKRQDFTIPYAPETIRTLEEITCVDKKYLIHWKHGGQRGCATQGEPIVSMHVPARYFANLASRDSDCCPVCADAAERFFAATLINEPYDPAKIHVSHDLESVGDVGHCKICRQGWMGEVMTPGLSSLCTKVKPPIDPLTGRPPEE